MRIELVDEKKGEKNCLKGEEDLSEKRKFRREIKVEKNTVTKVPDVTTRISGKVMVERMLKIIEKMILNILVIHKCQMC